METSVVRKRVKDIIESARRESSERRARAEAADRAFALLRDRVAVPLFRQVAASLKAEGLSFTVFTPSGSVRLASDRSADNFIEIELDTAGPHPVVLGRSCRTRGGRVIESEHPIADVAVEDVTEDHVLDFLAHSLVPMVER